MLPFILAFLGGLVGGVCALFVVRAWERHKRPLLLEMRPLDFSKILENEFACNDDVEMDGETKS